MNTDAIVIDPGTSLTKAGISSEDAPRTQFPTIVGKPKLPSIMVGMDHRDSYIGGQAQQQQNVLHIKSPVKHGFVENWEDMQQILHHIYYSELRVTPEEHPCLVAQSPKNPAASRHKLTEIMFQTLSVPQFYIANQSVLSLFGTGRTTGLVVDCGAGVTSSVPVYQGYAIPHAIKRNNFAGDDLDKFLIQKINKQKKIRLNNHSDAKVLTDVKSRITINRNKKEYQNSKNSMMKSSKKLQQNGFSLPDGNWLDVSSISTDCGQILFDPASFNLPDLISLPQLIQSTISQCDKDIRHDLFHNIITSGGSSNMIQFGQRLQEQLFGRYPSQSIVVNEKQHRQFLPWLGGSMLSCLSTFQGMWVTRQEYIEQGVSVIDKKCF